MRWILLILSILLLTGCESFGEISAVPMDSLTPVLSVVPMEAADALPTKTVN